MNMMDYEQWMEDEQELFSFPLDQKAQTDIQGCQDGVEISDLMIPAGNLLDQLDDMYPTDKELFPEWMSEKMDLNFLEEIQELSSEASEDSTPALLPLETFPSEEKDEKTVVTDLDILNQLVAYSVTDMQPLEVPAAPLPQEDAPTVTELGEDKVYLNQDALWEAISAASGLSSPVSSEDMSFLASLSPASSDDMDVFAAGSPAASIDMAVFSPSVDLAVSSPSTDSGNLTLSLPSVQSKPVETKPYKSKARSVLKTAQGTVKPSRKERKKDQNKQAATRYREKKRSMTNATNGELEGLEQRNGELKDTVESIAKEIKYLKDLLQEVLAVKGKLKEMGHKKA